MRKFTKTEWEEIGKVRNDAFFHFREPGFINTAHGCDEFEQDKPLNRYVCIRTEDFPLPVDIETTVTPTGTTRKPTISVEIATRWDGKYKTTLSMSTKGWSHMEWNDLFDLINKLCASMAVHDTMVRKVEGLFHDDARELKLKNRLPKK